MGRKSATEKEKPRDWLRFFVILLIRTNSSRYNHLSVCVASRYFEYKPTSLSVGSGRS